MTDLVAVLRAIVREELRTLRVGDLAVVEAAYPHADGDAHNHEVDLKLREGDLQLKKVPLATAHLGMVSAPAPGELVYVAYVGGDPNRPIVVGRLYSADMNPPVHEAGEWRVESPLAGKTSIAIDRDQAVVITAGDNIIKIKQSDVIEVTAAADLKLEVKGNVELKCTDCKVDASGNIDLGTGGGGVITTTSHKCFFTGAPLIGSQTVKAKG